MKIYHVVLTLLLSAFALNSNIAQTVYGSYEKSEGKAVVTENATVLAEKFKTSLNDPNAQISNIRFLFNRGGEVFLLVATVQNSKDAIRSIGIEMFLKGDDIVAKRAGGPVVTYVHTCTGNPCSNCDLELSIRSMTSIDAYCTCKESGGSCNHTTMATIGWQ